MTATGPKQIGKSHTNIQGDQKVSVHLMMKIQKVTSNDQSVIPNSNYVIMVGDWNCLKYYIFARFLCCNHQVHKDFLITL
jgi:uncharacterized membrane protein YccF (DUF307 family)